MFNEINELVKLTDQELHHEMLKLARLDKEKEILIITHMIAIRKIQTHHRLGYYSLPQYCEQALGFPKDVAKKRSQVVNVIFCFPRFFELLVQGKTHVSTIAMCANRITQANADALLNFLPHKSSREMRFFLSRLMPDGSFKDEQQTLTVQLRLNRNTYEMLEKARDLVSKDSRGMEFEVVLHHLLHYFLERKDPERIAHRVLKKKAIQCRAAPQAETTATPKCNVTPRARYIKAEVRHLIYVRDGGQCTYTTADGIRCARRSGLEIDHVKMFAMGGTHDPDNLRLICSEHNLLLAKDQGLGIEKIINQI